MTAIEPVFRKLMFYGQHFARKFYAEFYKNLTNGLVADTRSQTDVVLCNQRQNYIVTSNYTAPKRRIVTLVPSLCPCPCNATQTYILTA
jgi:hypothetical protein